MIFDLCACAMKLALLLDELTDRENYTYFQNWIGCFRDQLEGRRNNNLVNKFSPILNLDNELVSDGESESVIVKDAGHYVRFDDFLFVPAALVKLWSPPHNGACGYLCVGAAVGLGGDQLSFLLQQLVDTVQGASNISKTIILF
jgi:hypothetical protein